MKLMGIMVNVKWHDEYVPEVQRYIRTIKESVRVAVNTLTFEQLPHKLKK